MVTSANPTNAEVLGTMNKVLVVLEKSGGPKSRAGITPDGLFAGWQSPDQKHRMPSQKVMDQISKAYDSEEVLRLMVRDGKARAIGMGPALVRMEALAYPGKSGHSFPGYTDADLEKDYGFKSYSKARSDGIKGISGEVRKATALAEGAGITGGYLVPPQFQSELLTIAAEDAFIEPRARILPMTTRTAMWPMLDITTNYGDGITPYYGGVIATWQPESQTIEQTNPEFKMTEWTAWDLQLLTIASNQLLEDNGVGLDALLTQLFGGALTWYREYAFLRGMGAGSSMPLGVLNAPCLYQQSRSTANAFKLADAAAMLSRLQIRSWKDACWVMHQSVLPQLIQMTNGTSGFLTWLNPFGQGVNGPVANTLPLTFFGLPIFWTEKVPQLGTTGDVGLYDWSRYVIGQRMDMQIDVSREYRFARNQMTWRVISRATGSPWLSSTIHDASGYEISPFVALAA